ncbi:MAG: exonuclease domain-containing protein, partial [Burkholderiaceae bacterium]
MSDKPQMGLDLGLPEGADNLKVPKKIVKTGSTGVSQATLDTIPERMSSPPHAMAELQQISAAGADLSLADMAKLLDADPNYRVIQRLVPALHFRPVVQTQQGNVQRVAVLDTETTGLSAATDVIIELAVVVMDIDTSTGLPVGDVLVFDGFQDPGRAIPKEVQLLTG